MGPSGSTLSARPNRRALGAHPSVARVLSDCSPGELVHLLLPLVRRGLRTDTGPAGLVRWLRRRGAPRGAPPEPVARALTEDLVHTLFDLPGEAGDTLRDSRSSGGQGPATS